MNVQAVCWGTKWKEPFKCGRRKQKNINEKARLI